MKSIFSSINVNLTLPITLCNLLNLMVGIH